MWRSQAWAPVIFCSSGICRERTTTLRRWNKSSGISPNSTGLTARPSCFPWRCDWLTGNKKLKSNIWCTECEKHCYNRLEIKSYNRPCKCVFWQERMMQCTNTDVQQKTSCEPKRSSLSLKELSHVRENNPDDVIVFISEYTFLCYESEVCFKTWGRL